MEHREALDHHAEEFETFLTDGDEERWNAHLRHLGRTREAAGMAIASAKHRWQSCEGTPKLADACDCYACHAERLTVEGQREAAELPFGDRSAATDNSRRHERVGMQIHMTILLGATT